MRKVGLAVILILGVSAVPAYAKWNTSISKDEMTGQRSSYATSTTVRPTKIMSFPYGDTVAWLGIGCDGESEWVYIGFSDSPNLNGTEIEDGYNRIEARVKWNDSVEQAALTQKWGDRFIHFNDDDSAIANIVKSNYLLVELDWHGSGMTYFRFPLGGSAAALEKIRGACKR